MRIPSAPSRLEQSLHPRYDIPNALEMPMLTSAVPASVWPWQIASEGIACVMAPTDVTPRAGGGGPVDVPVPAWLSGAAPRRLADFVAGRRCAYEAIRLCGESPVFPPSGADRAPAWPAGVVGSITHSGGLAFAMAARAMDILGLGIDHEKLLDPGTSRDIAEQALTAGELATFGRDPLLVSMIFSAKESLFKALYPLVKRQFYFDAAELAAFNGDHAVFRLVRDLSSDWRQDCRIRIEVCRFGQGLLTCAIVRR